MPTDKPRVLVTISESMDKKITDLRFGGRFETKSEVVRCLIEAGLEKVMEEISTPEGLEKLRKQLEEAYGNTLEESDAQ